MKDVTPSAKVFDDIKDNSIKIWRTYDDTYGYATEKIERVNSISNYADNWSSIIGMFDDTNQQKLYSMLQPGSIEFLRGMQSQYAIHL